MTLTIAFVIIGLFAIVAAAFVGGCWYFSRYVTNEMSNVHIMYAHAIDKISENNERCLSEMAGVLESVADRLMAKSVHDVPRTPVRLPKIDANPSDGFSAMMAAGLDPMNPEDTERWEAQLDSKANGAL